MSTFLPKKHRGGVATEIELIGSTPDEKGQQIADLKAWRGSRKPLPPKGKTEPGQVENDFSAVATEPYYCHGLTYMQHTARERRNVFETLIDAVKTHSLRRVIHVLRDANGSIGGICSPMP